MLGKARGLHVVAFVAILVALLAFVAVPAFSRASESSEYTGYWKLVSTDVEKKDDYEDGPYEYHYTASELEHTSVMKGEYTEDGVTTIEVAAFLATCSAPPTIVQADEDVVLNLTLEMTENTAEHFHFRASARADGPDGRFVATEEDGEDGCDVWAIGDWGDDPTRKTEAEVCGKLGRAYEAGTTRSISWTSCDAETTWTYEWVDSSTPIIEKTDDEWEEYLDPVTEQHINTDASDTPGTQSNTIDSNVVEKHDPTEGGLYIVMAAGTVVIGGVTYAVYKRKRNPEAQEKNEKNEPKATYRMTLYKNFGNELRAGGAARAVGARIEKCSTGLGGVPTVEVLDAETQKIVMRGVQNLEASPAGSWNRYKMANVSVPKAAAGTAGASAQGAQPILELTYTGQGGTLIERVKFNLAPEPELLFVKEPDGVCSWFSNSLVNALIGDAQDGVTFYFAVENFTEQPDDPKIVPTDANISVECEPFEDKRLPKLYIYKVKVTNAIPFDSLYGEWPLKHKLHITVKNDFGEHAEDSLKLNLWPEGISFDVRQIKHERRRKDSVVVDTSDILMSSGPVQNIEGAVMEVAVAYKDDEGNVVVARPTEPRDGNYLRLEGEDDAASAVLNPKKDAKQNDASAPRVWYTLSYLQKPSYTQDSRLGSLVLTPLMPAVSKETGVEYRGLLDLTYDKGKYHFDEKVRFDVTGLSSAMKDADDVATERARIRKILNAYKLENWEHVAAVLQKHGPAAERELQHLGKGEDRQATGKTVEELMELVNEVQSLHRLCAIRKMVYEACELTAVHDAIKAKSTAEMYGFLYNTAITVRWANDIAFTCWCHAFMGPYATYVVPFIAPLRTWLEEFLAILASCLWDSEMEGELKKLFSAEKLLEIINKFLEDELLAVIVGALGTGGTSLLEDPRTYKAIGGAYCFFFLKHLSKNIYKSYNKGKVEYNIWGALKDATADLSIFSIKAVVAIVVARKFSPKLEPKREEIFKPSEDVFSYDGMNPAEKVIAKSFSWMVRTMEKTFNIVGNTLVKVGEGADDIVDHMVTRGDVAMTFTQVLTNQPALGTDAQREVWSAFYDVITQQGVEGAASEGFSAWVQRFGTVPFHLRDELGELKRLDVPLISFVAMWIDWVFEYLGIGGKLSIPKLDDLPRYYEHDELLKLIAEIEGAGGEVDFLLNPRGTDTSYSTSMTTGTWHTYDDSASGSSGTGIDTSTDTSTGW